MFCFYPVLYTNVSRKRPRQENSYQYTAAAKAARNRNSATSILVDAFDKTYTYTYVLSSFTHIMTIQLILKATQIILFDNLIINKRKELINYVLLVLCRWNHNNKISGVQRVLQAISTRSKHSRAIPPTILSILCFRPARSDCVSTRSRNDSGESIVDLEWIQAALSSS